MPKRDREEDKNTPSKKQKGSDYTIIYSAQKRAVKVIRKLHNSNRPLNASNIKLVRSNYFNNQTENYQKIYEASYLKRILVELNNINHSITLKIDQYTRIENELKKDLTIYEELQEKIQNIITTNAELIILLKESLQYNIELQETIRKVIEKITGESQISSSLEPSPFDRTKNIAQEHSIQQMSEVNKEKEANDIKALATNLANQIWNSEEVKDKAKIAKITVHCDAENKKFNIIFTYHNQQSAYYLTINIDKMFWEEGKKEKKLYLTALTDTLQELFSSATIQLTHHYVTKTQINDAAKYAVKKIKRIVGDTVANVTKIEIAINDFTEFTDLTANIIYKENLPLCIIPLSHSIYRQSNAKHKQAYAEQLKHYLQAFLGKSKAITVIIKNDSNENTSSHKDQHFMVENQAVMHTNNMFFAPIGQNSTHGIDISADQLESPMVLSIAEENHEQETLNSKNSESKHSYYSSYKPIRLAMNHSRTILGQITNKSNISKIEIKVEPLQSLMVVINYSDGSESFSSELPSKTFFKADNDYRAVYLDKLQKMLSNNLIKQSSSGSSYYSEEDQGLNINSFTQNPFIQPEPITEQLMPISKDVIPSIRQENLQFQSQFFAPIPQQPSRDQTHPLHNPSQLGIDDANNFIKQIEATGKKPNLADKFRAPYRVFKNNEAAKKLYLLGFDTTFDQYVQNQNAAPKPNNNKQ